MNHDHNKNFNEKYILIVDNIIKEEKDIIFHHLNNKKGYPKLN